MAGTNTQHISGITESEFWSQNQFILKPKLALEFLQRCSVGVFPTLFSSLHLYAKLIGSLL